MPSLKNGSRLGDYAIVRLLARGGMGEVYEAHEIKLDRRVALKVVSHENNADHDSEDLVRRFMQEARTLAKVNHPNVVTIHAIHNAKDQQYIAMEYVEGVSLKEFLDEYTLPIEIAVFLFEQILAGVKRLHEHGIVHRDLKPSNILIRVDGQIKILDFGIAKPQDSHVNTNPGVTVGTPPYMAPELRGFKAVASARSDFWSLGAIFFECLTGKLLVMFLEGNEFKFAKADLKLIPEEMRAIIGGMSAPQAGDRYRNANEIIDDVQRFRENLGQPSASALATFRDQLKHLVDSKRPKDEKTMPGSSVPVFDIDYNAVPDRMESSIRKMNHTPGVAKAPTPLPRSRSAKRKRRNRFAIAAFSAAIVVAVGAHFATKFKGSGGFPVVRAPAVSPEPNPRVTVPPPPSPPARVQLREPADRQLIWLEPAQNPTLSWSRILGAKEYDLQISLDGDFKKIIVNEPVNGNSFLPAKLLPEGVYHWRLAPVGGFRGNATRPQTFTLSRLEPVLLVKPIAGQVIETAKPDGAPVDFEWACRLGARLYNVQIAKDPEFEKPVAGKVVPECRWNNVALAPGSYYWRVRLEIGPGYREIWSTMRPFSIKGPPAPKVEKLVDLPAPQLRNAKQVQILNIPAKARNPAQAAERWIDLAWKAVGKARSYQVQLSQTRDFSDPFLEEKTPSAKFRWKATAPGQIYWRVRAVNSGGQPGRNSSVGVITVMVPPPLLKSSFKFTLPAGSDEPPVVEWRPSPFAEMYLVQMGPRRQLAGGKDRPTDKPSLELPAAPGRHYIRVAAANSNGVAISPYSNVATAMVQQELPIEAPRLSSPPKGAAAPSKYGRISIEFSWKAEPKADGYKIELAADPGFKQVLQTIDTAENRTLLEQAELAGRVYWRVKSVSEGKSSGWSEIFHFDVK